jgi:hypothetical protein
MDRFYKTGVISLLAAILLVLLAIYIKMPAAPPTIADVAKANGEDKRNLMMRSPIVRVTGTVEVEK